MRWLVLVLALGACAAPVVPKAPEGVRGGAQMRSIVGYDLGRLTGQWRQQAGFGCDGGRLQIAREAQGLRAEGAICAEGQLRPVSGPVRVVGPGRIEVAGQPEPWWLLWADGDARSMVWAPPSARHVVVMDRGQMSGDRVTAVRRILDFNGIDPQGLR